MDILRPESFVSASVERKRSMETLEELNGHFYLEHIRDGVIIGIIPFLNGATNVGKQYMLNAAFLGGSAVTNWYLGLIDGTSGAPIVNDADTMASHSGWTEFTYFDETTRQVWAKSLVTLNNTIASTGPALFTVSSGVPGSAFVAGGFITSISTKGGSTGTLWAHGVFAAAVPVQATDIFRLQYTTGL